MNYSWAIDQRKCIGCHACTTACKSENEVPLSVDRTFVKYVEKGTFPNAQRHFGVLRCNHCAKPPCVDICPVTAMFKRDDGIVEFNSDACIGCKACIAACPYDAIYIDPHAGTAAKCNFCTHRLDVGLEPACVVVCPEEALIFGDIDDPNSKISQLVGREKTQVRKPEKNTEPKCFYIGADEAVLNPDLQSHDPSGMYMWSNQIEQEHEHGPVLDNNLSLASALNRVTGAKVAYDVPHRAPWGSDVSCYLWTKSIASGVFMVAWFLFGLHHYGLVNFKSHFDAFYFLGVPLVSSSPHWLLWFGPLTGLIFLGLTGIFLIKDLDRPERFFTILTRPQWKSWLAIGAYIILFYSIALVLDLVLFFSDMPVLLELMLNLSLPLSIMTAIYTAYLFAQAKGRDLWQNPLLPASLFLQAVIAGSSVLMLAAPFFSGSPVVLTLLAFVLTVAIFSKLSMVLLGEVMVEHSSKAQSRAVNIMVYGTYKQLFWGGFVFAGSITPVVMLSLALSHSLFQFELVYPVAALLSLIGLFAYEHCFVIAGQSVRLS